MTDVSGGPPSRWWFNYLNKYSGPIPDILSGNMLIRDQYQHFRHRIRALEEIRIAVLQHSPMLNSNDKLVLSRPFYNWNSLVLSVDGQNLRIDNPHALNRAALGFQMDSKTIGEADKLIFDLVTKGLVP